MTKLANLKEKLLQNRAVSEEYQVADAEYRLIELLIQTRLKANLTQKEIAQRIKTTQSAIARLEGGNTKPTFETITKYVQATGHELQLSVT